jgi:predicted transcriptional regulator
MKMESQTEISDTSVSKEYLEGIEQEENIENISISPFEASKIVTDEYATKILIATYKKPKNANELSHRFGIPLAACYRRIRVLERAGLLTCVDKVLTQKGKRIKIYLSQLKNAYIFLEKGKLRVRFELKTGHIEDFGGEYSFSSATEEQMVKLNEPEP